MRWPFVSRGKYEMAFNLHIAVRDQYSARLEMAQHNLAEMRKQYDALLDKYHALRAAGANPTSHALPPAPRPAKPADEAIESVVERFGGNAKLRRRLQKYVNLERQKPDADEERIAENVLHWRDPESEDAA